MLHCPHLDSNILPGEGHGDGPDGVVLSILHAGVRVVVDDDLSVGEVLVCPPASVSVSKEPAAQSAPLDLGVVP